MVTAWGSLSSDYNKWLLDTYEMERWTQLKGKQLLKVTKSLSTILTSIIGVLVIKLLFKAVNCTKAILHIWYSSSLGRESITNKFLLEKLEDLLSLRIVCKVVSVVHGQEDYQGREHKLAYMCGYHFVVTNCNSKCDGGWTNTKNEWVGISFVLPQSFIRILKNPIYKYMIRNPHNYATMLTEMKDRHVLCTPTYRGKAYDCIDSCADDLQVRGFSFSANVVRQYTEISIVKKKLLIMIVSS